MGLTHSGLTKADIEEYEELTYFSKHEIIHVFNRFMKVCAALKVPQDSVRSVAVDSESLISHLPELKMNPFADRICDVFSSSGNSAISFDDFLDMMSVFSSNAPRKIKAEYAFRIYDFDGDDMIGREDMAELIKRLLGPRGELTEDEIEDIITNAMSEADLDSDQKLSFAEFDLVISKSSDFMNSFHIRL